MAANRAQPEELRTYASVFRRFPFPSTRVDGLSHGHHAAAAPIRDVEQRMALLEQARAQGWTVCATERQAAMLRDRSRDWSHLKENFSLHDLIAQGRKFRTIYADPPFTFDNPTVNQLVTEHYPVMSTDDICALPIEPLAEPNAMLHLWVPPSLFKLGLIKGDRGMGLSVSNKSRLGEDRRSRGSGYRKSVENGP